MNGAIPAARVAALLFGSGLSALAYQIAWQREFRLVFGSSTAASAAVLAIFIGGMGAGGLLLGRRADRHPRPLRLYADLELAIAASAALTPLLFTLVRAAYARLGGTVALGVPGGTALRLALAALVLAVPTLLMGGTLPAAVRGVQTDLDARRRTVGLLYATNTLGAVVGCLAANFWLLERIGTRATLWVACAVNAVIALAARWIDARAARAVAANADAARPVEVVVEAPESAPPASARWTRRFVYVAAAAVGFAFFVMELVWYRMLGPLLGGSIFTFGLILAVALLGIGVGGLVHAFVVARRPATLAGLALTCTLEAAFAAAPFALGDHVALLALALRPDAGAGLAAHLPGWIAVAALVILPAAIVTGAQYPLLISLLGRGRRDVAREIGAAAACNTAGAALGSLAGGFVLLPALSATGCWRMVVALLVLLGAAALIVQWRIDRANAEAPRTFSVGRVFGLIPPVIALACVAAVGPTAAWRHTPIGAGRVDRAVLESPNVFRQWLNDARRNIVWEAEGVESSVALDATDGLAFVVNGKVDGNSRGDAPTQVMGGILGALLHPNPKKAMVIGLGTGSTAGWLGAVPSIERVDVAELEPVMRDVARACAPVNRDAMQNPKLRVLLGDARETLITIPERYDVIFSEPSNPYRAGIASLFTREYYAAVSARLGEGGLFLQWVQLYEIDRATVETIYATLGSVFPEVETWRLGESDLVLVASNGAIKHDAGAIRRRAAEEPYRSALAVAWRAEGAEGALAHYVARASFAKRAAGAVINTDDRNRVEFGFARNVGNFARVSALLEDARANGENRPALANDDVDWARVDEERFLQVAAEGIEPEIPAGLPPDAELRAAAAVNYVAGNLSGTLAKWQFQARQPMGPTQTALVAEALAEAGDQSARPLIESLRAGRPVEADALLARLLFRTGKTDEAADRLVAAIVALRRDPWPWPLPMRRALELCDLLALTNPALAPRMLDALRQPFSVRTLETSRKLTALAIARRMDDPARCAEAWRDLEPHVPWDSDSLGSRRDCYAGAKDALAARAYADVTRFDTICSGQLGWLRCF